MTRDDRELAIADNVAYVGRVLETVRAAAPGIERVAFLGFSQGVGMAYRAAARCAPERADVIAVGGDVPPDLTAGDLQRLGRVLLCRGADDPHYPAAQLERDRERLERGGVTCEQCEYEGAHEFTVELLRRISAFLD